MPSSRCVITVDRLARGERKEMSAANESSLLFLSILESANTPALLPMLSAKQRWRLVIDVLLGHVPTRGGRTRDYPFSKERAQSIRLAQLLANIQENFCPGASEQSISIAAYDILVAIQCIEVSGLGAEVDSRWSEEEYFTVAMRALMNVVFPNIDSQPIFDALGISRKGSDGATRRIENYHRTVILQAKRLAALSTTQIPEEFVHEPLPYLVRYYDLRKRDIKILDEKRLTLVYLKTKSVQAFIDRCLTPFIQRGASFWCSQTTAKLRDYLVADSNADRRLLLDNDAVTIIAGSKDESLTGVERVVVEYLFDVNDRQHVSYEFLRKNYPRLLPYYQAARDDGNATAAVFPSIGLQVRHKTLLELAVDRISFLGDSQQPECIVKMHEVNLMEGGEAACSGRRGDPTIINSSLSIPTWYNPGRMNEKYGFPSIAFSLADLTFLKMSGSAIVEQLGEGGSAPVATVETQKELLLKTGSPNGKLTYLKFDGDGVGSMFSNLPSLRRPNLSVEIESLIRSSWIDANLRVMRAYHIAVNPSDLVYFGGDDILATIPTHMLDSFLQAFDGALFERQDPANPLYFTFAGISFIPYPETEDDLHGVSIDGFRIGEVNRLMNRAKAYRKVDMLDRVNALVPRPSGNLHWSSLRVIHGMLRG